MTYETVDPEILWPFSRLALDGAFEGLDAVAADKVARQLLSGLETNALNMEHTVLFLDVFDTLLLRTDECEQSRFLYRAELFQRELAQTGPRRDVLDIHYAKLLGFKSVDDVMSNEYREVSLREVIRRQVVALDLPEVWADRAWGIEIDHELSCLYPSPLGVALLNRATSNGWRVALLSDGYYSPTDVRLLLSSLLGKIGDSCTILTSSASGCNKPAGGLFRRALTLLMPGLERRAAVMHIGDTEAEMIGAELAGVDLLAWIPRSLERQEARMTNHQNILPTVQSALHASGWRLDQWR